MNVSGADVPGADVPRPGRACPHGAGSGADLAAELRALALLALDRLDPLLTSLRAAMAEEKDGACPVCVALAAVRGERPEPAGRLATHAADLAAALREAWAAALADAPAGGEPPTTAVPSRVVQHIPVDRVPLGRTSC